MDEFDDAVVVYMYEDEQILDPCDNKIEPQNTKLVNAQLSQEQINAVIADLILEPNSPIEIGPPEQKIISISNVRIKFSWWIRMLSAC